MKNSFKVWEEILVAYRLGILEIEIQGFLDTTYVDVKPKK